MELKLLLMESDPVKAIERMNKLNLIQFLSPSIKYDYRLSKLLNNIKDVISWFSLLYLEESFDAWKTYLYGLTSNMDLESVNDLASRLMMNDLESRKIINQYVFMKCIENFFYFFNLLIGIVKGTAGRSFTRQPDS